MAIRVLLVDDHELVRQGIAAMLAKADDLQIVGEARTGREAVEYARRELPDVILMDVRMSDMDGLEATMKIQEERPRTAVVMLTMHENPAYLREAVRAGAAGYLLKDGLRKELVDTIRRVHAGHRGISPAVAQKIVEHQAGDALTERELGVLMSVAAGNSNKIVADKLSISEETVKSHMRSILSKLGANDRTHAVTIAVKRGLISL